MRPGFLAGRCPVICANCISRPAHRLPDKLDRRPQWQFHYAVYLHALFFLSVRPLVVPAHLAGSRYGLKHRVGSTKRVRYRLAGIVFFVLAGGGLKPNIESGNLFHGFEEINLFARQTLPLFTAGDHL